MHTQTNAAPPAHDQALREARRTAIETYYRPLCDDLEEEYAERWLYVADDRGQSWTSTHATFEDLCAYAGGEMVDSGSGPIAAYDLDTGQAIELHVTTPIVSKAEEQGIALHPDLTGVR